MTMTKAERVHVCGLLDIPQHDQTTIINDEPLRVLIGMADIDRVVQALRDAEDIGHRKGYAKAMHHSGRQDDVSKVVLSDTDILDKLRGHARSVKAISPNDARKTPPLDFVTESVNSFLVMKKWKFTQNEIVAEIQRRFFERHQAKLSCSLIYDQKLLDFEDFYRENGWYVVYDKASGMDSYESFFEFSPR